MDYVFLEGLEVPCRVGCTERERQIPQSLRVDLKLGCSNFARAAETDDVNDTIDYALARQLIASVQARDYKLIETVAEVLARTALSYEHVDSVHLKLWKRAPVEGLTYSGVEITRHKQRG